MASPPRTFARTKNDDARASFESLSVLVAERDKRTAHLVYSIVSQLGFGRIDMVTNSMDALEKLEAENFDVVITELDMEPINGLEFVTAIRNDQHKVRRDLPVIMLTSKAQRVVVEHARDAGTTEFLVKPFTAANLAMRLDLIIQKPRPFVLAPEYKGPCRRRSGKPPEGIAERRGARPELQKDVQVLPPNYTLYERIDASATALLGGTKKEDMHAALLKAGGEIVEWAKDEIADLEKAYAALITRPTSTAQLALLDVARAIATQASIYGYALGHEVATMLAEYLETHRKLDQKHLTVVRKHIDTISVIFRERIQEAGQELGRDLISSLRKLIRKMETL